MKYYVTLFLIIAFVNGYSQEEKIYKSLEEALKNPESVFHLDLSGQGLTTMPKGFKKLVNVKTMNLSSNQFATLPNFNTFDNLEELNLSNNPLTWIPSFISLTGETRNIVSENNAITNVVLSDRSVKNISDKGFEGTIKVPSAAVMKSESDANGAYLKIMPAGESSERWMEIRMKGDLTNDALLNKIRTNSTDEFECFFNKHITYDKQMDTLPLFVVYDCMNQEGKVGIAGTKAMVFYDDHYITFKSNKRFIAFKDVKELLGSAVTYRPESENKNIQFSKKVFNTKSADDFMKMALLPEKINVPGTLPELTPTKETIYTLQAGETVAFTNEYQLGTSLKDKEYYIYYKKAGKYYVKTAKNVFGPYDDLPTAGINAPYSENFTAEFKAVKNKKAYFISDGIEMGPYPEDAYLFMYNDGKGGKRPVIRYEIGKENYFEIDGRKLGPYPSAYLNFWNGKAVIHEYSYTDPVTIYIDNELKFKDIKMGDYFAVSDGHLFFSYTKDGKEYVQFDEQSFGPYQDVIRKDMVDNKPRIWYKNEGKQYYVIDGKIIGPYDEIMDHYSGKIKSDFTYKNGGKFYITIEGVTDGPFDVKPNAILDDQGNFCYYSYTKDGKEYFNFKGKQYGPFEKVFSAGNDLTKMLNKEDKQPFTITKNANGTFSVFTYEKNYLGIKSQPNVYYSDSLNKTAISYSETNSAGENEFYLLMEDVKYGPFKDITTTGYWNSSYTTVYNYRFLITTLSGKVIRVDEDGIWGPFDKLEKGYGNPPDDKCKVGDSWFMNDDQKLVGPIQNVSFLEPMEDKKGGGTLYMQGSNVRVDLWGNGPNESYFNNVKLDNYYSFVGSNGKNFVMMTYEAGLKSAYIINNKLIKDKGLLNYAWDEETKTAYWLSLEGKNLVRYKLKL